jgi:hypothetical protein
MSPLRKTEKEVRDMEKTEIRGLSLEELEAQSRVELLPERIEMRRFRRRRNHNRHNHGGGGGGGGFTQDCDSAFVNTGVLPINVGGGNAICIAQ